MQLKESIMMTTVKHPGFWDEGVWGAIDDGVKETVCSIRVAQRVFCTKWLAGVTSVPAGRFNPERMTIEAGVQLPYVELSAGFALANSQVMSEPAGTTVIQLAKMAAKNLALAEDIIILRGRHEPLPYGVRSSPVKRPSETASSAWRGRTCE
jgi:hypothetical protein